MGCSSTHVCLMNPRFEIESRKDAHVRYPQGIDPWSVHTMMLWCNCRCTIGLSSGMVGHPEATTWTNRQFTCLKLTRGGYARVNESLGKLPIISRYASSGQDATIVFDRGGKFHPRLSRNSQFVPAAYFCDVWQSIEINCSYKNVPYRFEISRRLVIKSNNAFVYNVRYQASKYYGVCFPVEYYMCDEIGGCRKNRISVVAGCC